jgi:hypothetical protein
MWQGAFVMEERMNSTSEPLLDNQQRTSEWQSGVGIEKFHRLLHHQHSYMMVIILRCLKKTASRCVLTVQ